MADAQTYSEQTAARPLTADDNTAQVEAVDNDPTVVRETVPATGNLQSVSSIRARRAEDLRSTFGGMHWGADFLGFAVAVFFTVLLLGVVGAVVGAVGFQLHAPVPKVGSAISNTTQTLGVSALVGSLIALFIAYFLGGYAAGRMARYDGARNGLGVVLWTVIAAIVLGIAGAVLGNRFNVANQLHLNIDRTTMTTAGALSLAITLLVMILAAALGGRAGERYHRRIDAEAGVAR